MILDEVIERYTSNAEYERTHGNLQGCLEFRQLTEWLKDYKRLLEKGPCEDAISRQGDDRWLLHFGQNMAIPSADEDEWVKRADVLRVVDKRVNKMLAEPKTGYWIERRSRATGHIESVCSECGAEEGYPYNDYCGNCGTKMVEEQKSEVKHG